MHRNTPSTFSAKKRPLLEQSNMPDPPPPLIWLSQDGVTAKPKRRRLQASSARVCARAPPKLQAVPLEFVQESAPSTQWEIESDPLHCVDGADSSSHCVVVAQEEQQGTCGSPFKRQIDNQELQSPSQEMLFTVPHSETVVPITTTTGTQTSPTKTSVENQVAELKEELKTFMSQCDKRLTIMSKKLDRLLDLSVPRGNLSPQSGFTMTPLEEMEQLMQFNKKLDEPSFKEAVELWLTTMIQEADCRRRLNDAVELCLHKKILAKLTWTGVGKDKKAMLDFQNVLELFKKIAGNNHLAVSDKFLAEFFKAKLKNAPARLLNEQSKRSTVHCSKQ